MDARILIVGRDPLVCRAMDAKLRTIGCRTSTFTDMNDAVGALELETYEGAVLQVEAADPSLRGLSEWIRGNFPSLPVVWVSGELSTELALSAVKTGARDLLAGEELDQLPRALETALVNADPAQIPVRRLESVALPDAPLAKLIGSSHAMKEVRAQIGRIAPCDFTALVTGESGTGKELVARLLHEVSERAHGPFVAINCAAVPESLMESELFGHVKGAFTHAVESRGGLFVRAHGGTLFLDEVGAMPIASQARLLRALQARRVRPVGGDAEQAFDARIVAATNEDLHAAVAEGRFREDLLYRIDVLRVDLPALRDRGDDVLELAQAFLHEFATDRPVPELSEAVQQALKNHAWPGNVRELRNCIEVALTMTQRAQVQLEDLPASIKSATKIKPAVASRDHSSLEQLEASHIQDVLRAVHGNKVAAARVLGISRTTLYRKLRKNGKSK